MCLFCVTLETTSYKHPNIRIRRIRDSFEFGEARGGRFSLLFVEAHPEGD